MATNFSVSLDEVCCPVCHDIFTYPVILPCSHSLCKDCLQQCQGAGFGKCPVCRRACPPETDPPVNLALKNLCERFHQEQAAGGGRETLCGLHGEKMKLFCLVDKQPICVDCLPKLHNRHKCCHLKVAVHDHKVKMQAALKPLQEKMENFKKISETAGQKLHHIKSQAERTEKQIKKEFQKLHWFLRQEEAARIAALKAEETQRSLTLRKKMEEVEKKMEALSSTIRDIEQEMGKDDVPFLQNYNKTMMRTQRAVPDPDVSGVLIDMAIHLGNLKFQIWQKMQGMVTYTPVILDPNTAHPVLIVSEDLTALKTRREIDYYNDKGISLFGSQGFSSGKHQWDVELHRSTFIELGIAEENQREGCTNEYQSDHECVIEYRGNCECLNEKSIRGEMIKLRVIVDCERRTLSVFDVYGNEPFESTSYTLTGKLFPFFHFISTHSDDVLLKVMSTRVKVTV